jgi:hypothetical protein
MHLATSTLPGMRSRSDICVAAPEVLEFVARATAARFGQQRAPVRVAASRVNALPPYAVRRATERAGMRSMSP